MPGAMGDYGPFRPLTPYTESDRSLFFGREHEVAELAEKLSGDRPSALLLGEAGSGKTSLVRAALLPSLKSRGVGVGFVDGNALDEGHLPQAGSAGALLVLDDAGAALDEGPRFERLLAILGQAAQVRGLKILFVMDDADLWRLDALERKVGHVGPLSQRVRLERLDEARTADVVERTVLGGGAYFEAGLSREVAVDLTKDGPVSPAELQVVAAAAVALRANTMRSYRASGGADVLVWRFFERACGGVGTAAARVLGEAAFRDPRGTINRSDAARAAGIDEAGAEKVLAGLQQTGVLRRTAAGHVLASEWARPSARAFTSEARGRGVSARLLLRGKMTGGLLSPGQVREVRRYAGSLDRDEQKVVRRSVQAGLLAGALLLAAPIVLGVLTYGSWSRSHVLDAAPGPGASVVARLGKGAGIGAALPHAPSFGTVVADSGFTRAALREGVPPGAGPRSGATDDAWLRRVVEALRPLPRAAVALILDGDAKPLTTAYDDGALRPAVVGALGAAGRGAADEVALLKRALGDQSEDVRRRAVQAGAAIERRAPGAGTEILAAGVKDQAPSVRALALSEIERLPDAQSSPLLTQALAQTTDPVVRRRVLDAIGAQVARTPSAAESLGKAMIGPARVEAGAILSRLLDGTGPSADAAEKAVAWVALNDKAPEEARIDALKMLRRRPTTPAGIEGITGGSPKLQAALMPLILRAKPEEAQAKVAEAMKGPVPLRAAAAAAIGLLPKTPTTAQQLKVLQYDSSQEVHAEAVRALPVLGREALPLLAKEAKESGAEVERAAVETLGSAASKLGAPSAVQTLETVVRTARASTRRAAIEALGRLGDQKPALAAGALGRMLRDKAPEVRGDAANALGDVLAHGGAAVKDAVGALRAASKDVDAGTRKHAAAALGRAKGPLAPLAAKALAAFAGDADASVRADAAGALGGLGAAGKESGLLSTLLGDKEAGVRAAAQRAARAIFGGTDGERGKGGELDKVLLASFAAAQPGEKAEIATVAGLAGAQATVRAALADGDAGVRRAAAEQAGSGSVPALVAALGDPDSGVRVAAVRGLVGAKSEAALSQAARGPDPDVRVAALEALGDVGGKEAQRTLEAALSDSSERVRAAAARGLGALGPAAGDALEKALKDPARDVREAVVQSLGRVWSALPPSELAIRLKDETDADRRYAAALALVRQAETDKGAEARKVLEDVIKSGGPAARLAAKIGQAFIGHAGDMAAFLRLIRDGL
jgi:HEAT repeat protein